VEKLAFWVMTLSIVGITLFLTAAGATQVWLQRMSSTPLSFMETQDHIMPLYWARLACGLSSSAVWCCM
jgi:nitric oxide reductase subunit B